VVAFDSLRKAVQNEVGRLRGHQFITTMIDLYALKEFPGDEPAQRDVYARVEKIETAMATAFKSPQVIPYLQIHEFEALVFVDLEKLEEQFPDGNARQAVVDLRREVNGIPPELIDDGPMTAPSKRLLRALASYNKVVTGPAVAEAIGVARLREACPHFGTLTQSPGEPCLKPLEPPGLCGIYGTGCSRGAKRSCLRVSTVCQSSWSMPPVSPEFGFQHQ